MTNDLAIRIITGDVLGTSEQTQEAITMAVKALSMPSAQPKRRWIPCKLLDHYYIKELKDCDNKSYLVTYKTKTGRRYVKKVNIYHGKIQSKVGGKVIAWMPLPEAYEEDD